MLLVSGELNLQHRRGRKQSSVNIHMSTFCNFLPISFLSRKQQACILEEHCTLTREDVYQHYGEINNIYFASLSSTLPNPYERMPCGRKEPLGPLLENISRKRLPGTAGFWSIFQKILNFKLRAKLFICLLEIYNTLLW